MVRDHFRGNPSPAAAIGLGAAVLVVLVILGIIFLWPSSPEPPAVSVAPVAAAPAGQAGQSARLATSLRDAREESGMSLERAAAQADLSQETLSRFERGTLLPNARELDALCEAYEVTPEVRNELMDLQWTAAGSR
ncbi:hypothetical protein GCM10009677_25150 [Sphaerisporangium rubeum]